MTEPTDSSEQAPAKPKAEKAKTDKDRNNTRLIAAGAAMGIGSAALVAALLYTNRDKKGPAKPKPPKHAPESD